MLFSTVKIEQNMILLITGANLRTMVMLFPHTNGSELNRLKNELISIIWDTDFWNPWIIRALLTRSFLLAIAHMPEDGLIAC